MKKLLLALALVLFPSLAFAQCNGQFAAGSLCGSVAGGLPGQVPAASVPGILSLTNANIFVGNASNKAAAVAPTGSGDCTFTFSNLGVFGYTCTKTNGVAFVASATTDTTNATNISGGTLNTLRLPSPFTSGTASGNTSKFATMSGSITNTHLVAGDASGNLVDGGAAGAGTVTSVTCGTGLSGGTFTVSGTCAVNLTTASNVLGADVNLSATATYFDGPSVAQGTSGTWWVSGTVTVTDTANAQIYCKLWDGTTVIASTASFITAASPTVEALSGFLASPAANIRISCRDITNTTGKILFNITGNSKDATISAHRIQ